MKTYLIPIIISVVALVAYFSISPTILQEDILSKHCDITYDVNFLDRGRAISGPNDGKPNYSIAEEFSIFYTVPIGEFSVDDVSHSLILKPVQTSHGYIIMCDPLPVLEKRFDTKLHGLFILVDGEEIEPNLANDVLRIDVYDNTRIEIIGFTFV
ncbi:hypothetical protein [Nitrosopumilus sp. b2]|uniref:hypothetical protein n=1 Tax=Nitrosopumilus sp. b2 TaxID=2109908 RepID=UPI0015F3E559|nr:hypothetical protein [Nitrosopumilus sp. b2]KAF6245139.1 hypothetical protein C6989_05155 [Nitrosopumilus sp. b2]